MQEKIKRHCPSWSCQGYEQEFIRVVEIHESYHVPQEMGTAGHAFLVQTSHPTAYCPTCGIVIFVGPTPEEVRKDFEEKQERWRREREKERDRIFSSQLPKDLQKS